MRLALIYAEVPTIACKGLCQACCGPIMASDAEVRHFELKTGHSFPDPLEVLQSESMACPELNVLGKCSAYSVRPLICRLWGVVDHDGMRCPHGCTPNRWMTNAKAKDLQNRAEELV